MKKYLHLNNFQALAILSILGCLIYSNTFKSAFVFDDFAGIVNNPIVHNFSLSVLWHAFNTRFVVGLSLALNYALGQDNVVGYHLFNTLVHTLNAFLVYKLVCLTFKTPRMSSPNALVGDRAGFPTKYFGNDTLFAFLTALIFLTHPIQTQAVTYIWQRATSLASFFYLGSLVFYVRGRLNAGSSRPSPTSYLFCLLFAVLGMFTKEIVFTLPFAIALYEVIFLREIPLKNRTKALLWVPLALSLLLIPWTMTQSSSETLEIIRPKVAMLHHENILQDFRQMTRTTDEATVSRHDFILTEMNVLRTYLRLFVFPVNQNVDYDYPRASSLAETGTLLSLALLLSLLGAGFLLLKKHPILAFGIFWFFLTVSLESLVVQEEFIFEHRMYLPMVGLCLFLVTGIAALFKNHSRKLILIFLALVACYSFLTYQRNFVWRTEFSLWDDAIKKAPNKARAHSGRGDAYIKQGRMDMALLEYNQVIALRPHYYAYDMRGSLYGIRGQYDLALADLNKAIELNPRFGNAYHNRANLYFLMKDYSKSWQDVIVAQSLGFTVSPKLLEELKNASGTKQIK